MKARGIIFMLLACAFAQSVSAQQSEVITLEQALARARNRGPQIILSQYRIDEARGRLAGASVFLQENPTVETAIGPRISPSGDTTDYDVSLSQSFELGGRRSARMAGARAGLERETAASRDVLRRLLRDVSVAFARGLAAKQRLKLAEQSSKIAGELFQSMERRYQAGDVPILDVNLARNSAARARADVRSSQAAYASAVGELRILLGVTAEEPLDIAGDLRDRRRFDLSTLTALCSERPDLRALAAERDEAQAEVQLGNAFRWPTVAPSFNYKRDQGDRIVQGGLSFTLPLFNRGQELQAVGQARTRRLERELEASKRAVWVEVQTAYDVYNLQVSAVEELERDALPSLEENETLARRSFEEGEIGLAELLLIRREALETRIAYAERLFEAAVAGIELEARAGVLR
ncbi:MAG TPA: TolC family protein [Clostridia bacterium]|nr:TolC family protein [Clostridia bacterium]